MLSQTLLQDADPFRVSLQRLIEVEDDASRDYEQWDQEAEQQHKSGPSRRADQPRGDCY